MRTFLVLFLMTWSLFAFPQRLTDTNNYRISEKTIQSLKYHIPLHKSPRLKFTCRTAFNKEVLTQALDDYDLSEIFDEVQFSQFVKYNLRVRWKFKNKNKIFIGAETMSSAAPGFINSYYIGFRKFF
jgi:hypothetical protein